MASFDTPSFSSPTSHDVRLDVIVDPADDVANVYSLQALARADPTVLTISIPPRAMGTTLAPIPEFLWALGKRQPAGARGVRATLPDVHRWLLGYRIREVIVLQAQCLTPDVQHKLFRTAHHLDLNLALLYSGRGLDVLGNTTMEAFLARCRRPVDEDDEATPWPALDEVDLLDYRVHCIRGLSDSDYERVDHAFRRSADRIERFFRGVARPSRDDLRRVLALATGTQDDQLREILLKGALVGLLRKGRALPNPQPIGAPFTPQLVPKHQLDELLIDVDPARAALQFLRLWTNLSDSHLSLIGSEQVTATTVAGTEIPTEMHPIFRALTQGGSGWEPFAGGLPPRRHSPLDDDELELAIQRYHESETGTNPRYADRPELVAGLLSRGIGTPRWPISRRSIPLCIRQEVEDLCQRGILESRGGNAYEITSKAVSRSREVSMTSLRIGASPEEILSFLIKHRADYMVPQFRPGQTKEERRHLRLTRMLSYLVTFGSIDPDDTNGVRRDALESLRAAGYVANFGPLAYRLTDRATYSLCWNQRPSDFGQHPKDYDPAPRRPVSAQRLPAI